MAGIDVTITLVGVREEHLPRLRTAIKGHLARFASVVKIDPPPDEPKPKSRFGRRES